MQYHPEPNHIFKSAKLIHTPHHKFHKAQDRSAKVHCDCDINQTCGSYPIQKIKPASVTTAGSKKSLSPYPTSDRDMRFSLDLQIIRSISFKSHIWSYQSIQESKGYACYKLLIVICNITKPMGIINFISFKSRDPQLKNHFLMPISI